MDMRLALICLTAATLSGAFVAGAHAAPGSTTAAPAGAATPTPDYLRMAAQSDEYERQAGQLAAASGASTQVKDFGRMMVQDHTKSSADLVAAAKASGMNPPPVMMRPDQQQMVAELRRMTGAGFDRAYVMQQVMAHNEALMLHSNYARAGSDARLKAAAAKIVPVVQHHLDMAKMMQASAR